MSLNDIITLATATAALALAIIGKNERSGQACAFIVLALATVLLLEPHIDLIDSALNNKAKVFVGIALIACAIIASMRIKHHIIGSVLLTCSGLLTLVLLRMV